VVLLHTLPIINSDFFWHIATGKLIVDTGSIPHEDPFSYTAAGTKWVTHEWLFEVFTWLIYSVGSYEAAGVARLVVLLLAVWLPISLWRRTNVSPLWILVCASTGVLMAITRSFWRPHLLGILMVSIFLKVLEDYVQHRINRLWVLPLLTIVWVNWHSGAVLGIGLVFLYAAIECLAARGRRDDSESSPAWTALALFAVLSLACGLVNPNTVDALMYPVRLVESYSSTYGKFAGFWELQPITLDIIPSFWFSVTLVIVGLIASWRKVNVRHAVVIVALMAASIYRLRLIELYVPGFIAFGPGLMQALTDRVNGKPARAPSLAVNTVLGIGAVAMVGGLTLSSLRGPPSLGLDSDLFPVACADWVEEHDPPGYMYNDIDIGGYLTYRLYPERRVFWDNRLLVFEPLFERLLEGESVEDIHHIDWVIDVNSEDLNPYTPDSWALVAFDERHSLYIKRSGAAGRLIDGHEYFALYPCRPEDGFRNARDYPREVEDRLVSELDRFLDENRTRYGRCYAAGVFAMLGDEHLARARELISSGLSVERRYKGYQYYDALCDYAAGDPGTAERKIRRLLFWYPRSSESRFLLGRILAGRGDYLGAERLFSRVISDGYSSPAVLFARAWLLHGLGDDGRAIEMLESYFRTVSPRDYQSREYADAITLGRELMGEAPGR